LISEKEISMSSVQTAEQVLERHFLELRCGLLDLAAAFDRISRAEGAAGAQEDPRMHRLQQAIQIVASEGTDRAERLQLLFSDEYVEGWNRK
jgi:LPS O-antigen subunit length determinant protein (WzzB/FepE family)